MRSLAILVVVAATAPVFAQAPADTVAKVEATYAAAAQVTATFSQDAFNHTFGAHVITGGTLAVERPNKLAFAYVNKKGKLDKTFLFDGTDLWYIEHLGKRVTQQAVAASALPAAISFLAGSKGAIAKQFTIGPPASSSHLVAGALVVELTPRQPSAAYTAVQLVVDPATFTVSRTVVYAPTGDVTTFTFTDVNLAAKLPAATFVFDAKKFDAFAITTVKTPVTPSPTKR